jgi:hypothetical protein
VYTHLRNNRLDPVAHAYGSSYSGCRDRRIISLRPAWIKLERPQLKNKVQNVVQVIEQLPSICKTKQKQQ